MRVLTQDHRQAIRARKLLESFIVRHRMGDEAAFGDAMEALRDLLWWERQTEENRK